jgi:methionine synthase I (cobalamin-dependent)
VIAPSETDAGADDANARLAPSPPLSHRLRLRLPILEQLNHRPLLLDAAMGTRLIAAGLDLKNDDPALWCLTHPEAVAAIHLRDCTAGADAILTNTFGANRPNLARFDQVPQLESINRRAVQLARAAAGLDRFVLGCVGPAAGKEKGAAAQQAVILVSECVDALLLETFRFPDIEPVLEEVLAATGTAVPVFVSLWDWPDPPEPAARRLIECGAAVLGQNCQPGARPALTFARRLSQETSVPLLVKPGVGIHAHEAMSPADLAEIVPELVRNNVRYFGGCCGTTEEHLAAVAASAPFHRVSFAHPRGDKD